MRRTVISFLFLSLVAVFYGCKSEMPLAGSSYTESDVLVSAKFDDDNTYIIICKGFPMKGAIGETALNSAQDGARLNAIYFVTKFFDPAVNPTVDGKADHYEKHEGYVLVYYKVKKAGLKKYYKQEN